MSIVHVDKIWETIAKNFEMRTSGGGGGGVVSDFGHPRTRGGGGVKKGQIFADVLYGWPLSFCAQCIGVKWHHLSSGLFSAQS